MWDLKLESRRFLCIASVLVITGFSSATQLQNGFELLSELDGELPYCLDLSGVDYFYHNPFLAIDIQYVESDQGVVKPHVLRMFDHWLLEEYNGTKQITASDGEREEHCYSQMLWILTSVSEDSSGSYARLRFLVPEDLDYLIIKYRFRCPRKQYTSYVHRIILADDYYHKLVSEGILDEKLKLLRQKLETI